MRSANRRLIKASALIVLLSAVITGCGGGTTGTSPTDEFKFLGSAKSASGAPLTETAMTVRSGTDDSELLQSQTDSSGLFEMDLPTSENSVVVAVAGTRSAPLERSFNGASIVSTEMVSNSAGDLKFQGTFEVQIDSTSLCSALQAEGNQLYQQAPLPAGDCLVVFIIRSQDLSVESFAATISGDCEAREPAPEKRGDSQIVVDVSPYLNAGCSVFEVGVSHRNTPQRAARFPVYSDR